MRPGFDPRRSRINGGRAKITVITVSATNIHPESTMRSFLGAPHLRRPRPTRGPASAGSGASGSGRGFGGRAWREQISTDRAVARWAEPEVEVPLGIQPPEGGSFISAPRH